MASFSDNTVSNGFRLITVVAVTQVFFWSLGVSLYLALGIALFVLLGLLPKRFDALVHIVMTVVLLCSIIFVVWWLIWQRVQGMPREFSGLEIWYSENRRQAIFVVLAVSVKTIIMAIDEGWFTQDANGQDSI